MAIDYFVGWTEADLETELRRAQEELARGKTITDASAGDSSFRHQVQLEITERIKLLLRKLSVLNPTDYPPESVRAITRTQIVFPVSFGSAGGEEAV